MDEADPSTTSGLLASSRAEAPRDRDSHSGSGRLEVRCPNCHTPIEVAVDTLLTDLTCSICGSHFSLVDQSQATRMAPPLSTMGRFELIERLGVGGFGSVWKARDRELDRTVAIKIPRQGGMTTEEQEKFFREARAAAQLRHPSIVSVHEVGRDGENVYIVSDFVRGVTLGDWLTGQKLTSREAAELCAKIADALQHAHEQGVVHRDLKPANIMIDGAGEPHLMDFGLARRDVGEVTVTMDGEVLGTPAYMSPEQALGEAHTADRRSDVYSLGVILFQLLTGELPFRGNARMIMHQVIHDEPPSPRKLNANVSDDLETITLKCLEKEPPRRYSTAREMADDLRRFLASEPIQARPISRSERAVRWVRRNRAVAALGAAVVFVLITGTIISAYFAVDAQQKAQLALEREHEADTARREAEELTEFLAKTFEPMQRAAGSIAHSELAEMEGRVIRRLEHTLSQRRKTLGEDHTDTLSSRYILARAYHGAGHLDDAIALYEETVATMQQKLGQNHAESLASMIGLASAYRDAGRRDEAIALYQQTLNQTQENLGPVHPLTLESITHLSEIYVSLGRTKEIFQIHDQNIAVAKRSLGPDHLDTLTAMENLALAYFQGNEFAKALPLYEEIIAGRRDKLGPHHAETLAAMERLALIYEQAGQMSKAIPLYEQVVAARRKTPGGDQALSFNSSWDRLADAYVAAGRLNDAIRLYEEAFAANVKKSGVDDWRLQYLTSALARTYGAAGEHEKAIRLYEETLAVLRKELGSDHKITLIYTNDLAYAYRTAGRLNDAIQLLEKTLAEQREIPENKDGLTLASMELLASAYVDAGRLEEGIRLYEQALAALREQPGDIQSNQITSIADRLEDTYREAGRVDEANKLSLELGHFFQVLQIGQQDLVDGLIEVAMSGRHRGEELAPLNAIVLGEMRLVGGDPKLAEPAIRAAIARGPAESYMYKTLGWCLLAQGKTDEAKRAFEEALGNRRRPDGSFDMKRADIVQITAAYFLDVITEEQYIAYTAGNKRDACFPWFYVGQRREIEGNREAAIVAYEKCVELGDDETAHSNRALARWRLAKLREGAVGKTDLQQ